MTTQVVYYSSATGNTKRFFGKVGAPSIRIKQNALPPIVSEDFVLGVPTYADGKGNGAIVEEIIRFLNIENNRKYLKGVIGFGNRNFGRMFTYAAHKISIKCKVPLLYQVELFGLENDVHNVQKILNEIN